jgi:hypothetical protein
LIVARHVYQLDKRGAGARAVKLDSAVGSIDDRQLNQKSKL